MEYTNITFSKTKQAAQYEPETMEVSATLDSGDNLLECAAELKAAVSEALSGKTTAVTKKKTVAKKEVEEAETPTTEEAPKKKAPAKKTKAPAKKKNIAYDRSVQAHKSSFGELALEVNSGWQKDADLKAIVKGLSESMEGKPMFNGVDGEILEPFRAELTEGMTSEDDDL